MKDKINEEEYYVRGTYKVKVSHAPLQDVMLTGSLEWQS